MQRFVLPILLLCCIQIGQAQGYYFGLKGGLTIGTQQWQSLDRDPLFRYHGIAFVESIAEENSFGLFAQAGFHEKGSAIRNRLFRNSLNGGFFRAPTYQFIFRNASLTLGAKQKFDLGTSNSKWFYLLGIRGDYTLNTNLGEFREFIERNPAFAIFPIDEPEFINEINYGVTVGGGVEFPFTEFIGLVLEFTLNPDFSFQYVQPAIPNVQEPFTGTNRTIPERQIRNLTLEVTVGFRFLRKVEYID